MKTKIDKYEKDILESFTKNEWREVPNMDEEIKRHKKYVHKTLNKNKQINIKFSQKDVNA